MGRAIDKDTNYQVIRDGWYCVRTVTASGAIRSSIQCITPDGLRLIERGEGERDLVSSDLEVLSEGYVNKSLYDQYVISRVNQAVDVVRSELGIDVDVSEFTPNKMVVKPSVDEQGNRAVYASSHALERWVERKLAIEVKANNIPQYVKQHRSELESQVIEAFKKAELFYEGTDADFYLDADNITYVFINSNIITLYPQYFGFTPEINRTIAFAQLAVLKQSDESLSQAVLEYEDINETNSQKKLDLHGQVRVLESQIAELKAEMKQLDSETGLASARLRKAEEINHAEFHKLFKKFKPQL